VCNDKKKARVEKGSDGGVLWALVSGASYCRISTDHNGAGALEIHKLQPLGK